ncbi:MAG: 30S ribosomal protein S18 [Myxococcota bacterium]
MSKTHDGPERESQDKKLGCVNYHDAELLKKFMSPEGRILPQRRTDLCAKDQRKIRRAIKRARCMSLVPFANPES